MGQDRNAAIVSRTAECRILRVSMCKSQQVQWIEQKVEAGHDIGTFGLRLGFFGIQ